METWSCDFETVNDVNDCRIWAWGAYNLYTDEFVWGTNLYEFNNFLFQSSKTIYFHNAAFDCEFLITHLFKTGYQHIRNEKKLSPGEFKTLISDDGLFYTMKIKHNEKVSTTVYDSLKIIPLKVAAIPKAFGLEIKKGEIEYNKERPIGYIPDENELEYLKYDCKIVAQALRYLFEQGLVKMTQASNALNYYKQMIGNKNFNDWYPNIDDSYPFIKASYKGGFVYLNPKFKNKIIEEGGEVYDVNSLYPAMMLKNLPWGKPQFFYGQYQENEDFPLYIQALFCSFELKKGYLPTIQLKHNYRFSDTEYLTSSDGEQVYLVLTSVDLKLFFDHYDVYNIEYAGGYMYRQSNMLFTDYIEHWNSIKVESAKTGNKGMRQIAKLMLNSLYGKFGTNPNANVKWPTWDESEQRIRYKLGELPPRKTLYLPVASFITSYAREWTIRSAQKCYDRFIYADTDSLHISGHEPIDIDIDDTRLGAWKNESSFSKGKYLRSKCYIEYGHDMGETEERLKITVAGMPPSCYPQVTFDNFNYGTEYTGKLHQQRVSGGIVLSECTFKIKGK